MSPTAAQDLLGFWYMGGLAALGVAVAWSDFTRQKIPNVFLLLALAYAACVLGWFSLQAGSAFLLRGLGFSLFGMVIGTLMLLPALFTRQVAPGDVKFMMVIGFFLGPLGAVFALLNGALVGGLWALAIAWRHGGLRHALHNIRLMWHSGWLSGFRELGWDLRSAGAIRMPYGVALAAGAWSVIAWQLLSMTGRG